mgnify:CR=1 FL=1|jgi:hypothetical protein
MTLLVENHHGRILEKYIEGYDSDFELILNTISNVVLQVVHLIEE